MKKEKERPVLLSTNPADARLLLYCYGLFILVSGLGWLFPGYYTWSVSFLDLLPNQLVISLLGLAFISLYPLLQFSFPQITTPAYTENNNSSNIRPTNLVLFLAFVVLTALLFFLRSKALVYGDGYMVLSEFSSGQDQFLNYQDYLKGLALLFHKYLFKFLTLFFQFTPSDGFALINSIGGSVAIIGLYKLCGEITENHKARIFYFVGAITSGAMIIFMGHIEYYTWAMTCSIWSLLYSIKYIKDGQGRARMICLSLLAVLFHILTLPFLIIALVAMACRTGKAGGLPFGLSFWKLNLAAIVFSTLLASIAQLSDLPQWLMLIYPIDGVPYWFLSPERLIDLANHLWLVAPIGFLILLSTLLSNRFKLKDQSITTKLLGSAALWSFLVCFWVEPKLGAARDFDFTSFYAFPLTIWAMAALVGRAGKPQLFYRALPAALTTMIIVLAPNIYEKLDAKRAAENLDTILWDSPHHQANYGNARRAMVWGVAIMNDAELPDLSVRSFRRRLAAKPDDYSSWFNLGQIYFGNDYPDSAAFFFTRAVEYKPGNHIYLARLAEAEFETGRLDRAAEHIGQAASLAPALYNVRYLAGLILRETGASREALEHLNAAARLNSKAVGPFSYIGLIFYEQQQYDSAYNYLNRSLAKNPMNKPLYPPLIRTNLALGKVSEAAHVLNIYRQISPESGDIIELQSLVNELSGN